MKFMATGLAHMGFNGGALVRIERGPDGIWQMQTVLELGAAPLAFSQPDEQAIVVALSRDTIPLGYYGRAAYRSA